MLLKSLSISINFLLIVLFIPFLNSLINVVATTRLVFNSSTSNKSHREISSGEHELCNLQENSTENHNSILLTIYITYPCVMD